MYLFFTQNIDNKGKACKIENSFWQGNPYYQLTGENFFNWYYNKINGLNLPEIKYFLQLLIDDYNYLKNSVLNPINYNTKNIHANHFRDIEELYFNDSQINFFIKELQKLSKSSTFQENLDFLNFGVINENNKFQFNFRINQKMLITTYFHYVETNKPVPIVKDRKGKIKNQNEIINWFLNYFEFNKNSIKQYFSGVNHYSQQDLLVKNKLTEYNQIKKIVENVISYLSKKNTT